MKLFLFIDGLDEFDGNEDSNDRQHMIELPSSLASSRFIKLCVSSRPLLIFEEAIKTIPDPRLQDLTFGDIRRYIVGKLSTDSRAQQIADHDSSQKHDFVKEVCNMFSLSLGHYWTG